MKTIKAKIIMLPTKDKEKAGLCTDTLKYGDVSHISMGLPSQIIEDNTVPGFKTVLEYQHLYFITDDEIKSNEGKLLGDWVWNSKYNKIFQMNGDITEYDFKIVATTDPKLAGNVVYTEYEKNVQGAIQGLPKPSQEFIKKYCEAGGIDEVLIEITPFETCPDGEWVLGGSMEREFINQNKLEYSYREGIKINPDNTVNIHPIKDSWNREEVQNIITKLLHDVHSGDLSFGNKVIDLTKSPKQWFEENL
jgi:hypothetical protein